MFHRLDFSHERDLNIEELVKRMEAYYPDADFALLKKAYYFAEKSHKGQMRSSGEEYIIHPLNVAGTLVKLRMDMESVIAGLLHDVVEDTPVELVEIENKFGPVVATYVDGLTDISRPEDGNRTTRKEMDRKHTAEQPAEVQTIKLADLIHNTASIEQFDPSFYKVYKQEKIELLKILTKGDKTLMWKAQQQIGGN